MFAWQTHPAADLARKVGYCLLPLALGAGAALALLLAAGGPARSAYAGTLTFRGCGATIQACIDGASTGDTLLIQAGDYTESLTLSKAVSLTGALSSTTILHALPNTRVLTVTGAAVDSSVVISGLTFTGGNVTGTPNCPDSCGGGMVVNNNAQPSLVNLRLINNTASLGGGGLEAEAHVILRDVQFISNSAFSGGGAYLNSTSTLLGGLFQGNSASGGSGGLAAVYHADMTGTQFISNTAVNSAGGAAMNDATLNGVLFQGNSASDQFSEAGGLWTEFANLTGTVFLSNTAFDGGGMFVLGFGAATLTNTFFLDNSAGLGVLYAPSAITITGGGFIDNSSGTALVAGGAVAISGTQFIGNGDGAAQLAGIASQVRIVNSLLAGNRGNEDLYVYVPEGSVTILNSTFADPGVSPGQAVYVGAGAVGITNSIIASYTTGISLTAGSAFEDYNLFFNVPLTVAPGVASGGHSLVGNPAFQDPTRNDYHLTTTSAARDTGADDGVTTDFDGEPRPSGPGFDIGFDEIQYPVAVADSYDTPRHVSLVVPAPGVLANDISHLPGPLTETLAAGPLTGTLDLQADGAFTYTPALDDAGPVTFSYQANGGGLLSAPATVTVVVNQPPIANAGASQFKTVGQPVTLDGSASADPDNNLPLAYGWQQTGGAAVVLSSATISRPTFTAPGAPAVLTFILTVSDAFGLVSLPATTTVTVTDQLITGLSAASNSPTVFGQGTPFTATISAGTNVSYSWGFGNGASGSGASITYTYPATGFYTALVTATNSLGSITATTMVTVDDIPIAGNDFYTTPRNVTLQVAAPGILANDIDTFPGGLTADGVSGPLTGTLVLASSGAFTYTPPIGFGGVVTFTYQSSDGILLSAAATVTLFVNQPPVANAGLSQIKTVGQAVTLDGSGSSDPDNNLPLAYGWTQTGGTAVVLSGATISRPTFIAPGVPGVLTFTLTVSDALGLASAPAATTVIVDDVPIAISDSYTTTEDTPLHVAAPGVLANDTDAFPGGLTAQWVPNPLSGTLDLAPSGEFTYTPPLNFNGPVTFTYRASDGTLSSLPATVTITVTSVNDPPTLTAPADVTTTAGTAAGPLSFTVGDVETPAGALTVTAQSGNTVLAPDSGIVLGGSGAARTVTITPTANLTGTATITLAVSDGLALTTDAFTLTVTSAGYKVYLPLVKR